MKADWEARAHAWIGGEMADQARSVAELVFRCPLTGQIVRASPDDAEDLREIAYHVVICAACSRLHFINRKTRKLFGVGKNENARGEWKSRKK